MLDASLLHKIDRLTREVAADDAVRVLVVDSTDPEIFIAHADVELILDLPAFTTSEDLGPHPELSLFHAVTEQVRTLPMATVAVIQGVCRGGGCEFAMAFDMRFAALGTTVLGHPEVAPAGAQTRDCELGDRRQ
ncbi:enoyl-CoA hydratase/isomerase family protein [Mycobacterium tilburgii]|uniref:enoyl-CoA hydratase/isomerase family protein n=1 Tax=Mycobacterium tilburgii TaxID=44467 RepID=UPI0021B19C1E|nr:enoyl-CoA hydratase/isomerase family protein [Mycobacterium tilburgii]